MTRFITIFLVMLMATVSVGCKKSNDNSSTPSNPGTPKAASLQFQRADYNNGPLLSKSVKLASTRAPVSATPATDISVPATVAFNVGNIDSTTTYLFMLKNTGDTPAFNVNIVSDNPAVEVSPGTIGILEPDGISSIDPIIKVTVKHGINASGIGSTALLPPGLFVTSLTASAASGVFTSTTVGGVVRVADLWIENADIPNQVVETEVEGGMILKWRALGIDQTVGSATSASGVWGPRIHNYGNCPLYIDSYGYDIDGLVFFKNTTIILPLQYYDPLPNGYTDWYGGYLNLMNVRTGGVQSVDRVGDRAYRAAHAPITVAN